MAMLVIAPVSTGLAQGFYIGGGVSKMEFDDSFDSVSPTNMFLRGGILFNDYFDISGEMNITFSSDEISGVDFDVDTYSIFLRGIYPATDTIRFYGKFGTANTELTASAFGTSISFDDDDMMYGAGVEVGFGQGNTYLDIDYTSYYDDDGIDVNAFNVGLGYRF